MPEAEPQKEMPLRDYASVIWRRKWIVILPALLTALVATGLSMAQAPQYRASADVLVRMPATAYSVGSAGSIMSPRLIENELQAANGSVLKGEVRQTIGTEPTLKVTVTEGSDVFTFTATSTSPDRAALAANTHAKAYIASQRDLLIVEYDSRVGVIEEQLAAIERGEASSERRSQYERELEDLGLSIELARTSGSVLIDEATPPGTPFEPNTMRTATLALVVGLLIGLGAAFLIDYLDTTVRDEEDLIRATGLPNLAVIPNLPNGAAEAVPVLVSRDHPHSPSAEAFRGLQTSLRFIGLERTLHTVLVTSARPGEGKTTTATNLALTAARSGQRVVLVDCDLRKPQAHLFFDLPNEKGFTSILLGEATMQQVAHQLPDARALAAITSGPIPPNPSELLANERTKGSLNSLGDSVDLVIIDSPPILPVSDPVMLAGIVDGVIVVASAGMTDRRKLTKSIERLHQVDAPLLGTVLNRHDSVDTTDYSYGYDQPATGPPDYSSVAGQVRPQEATST
jgi:capsular exopolysaccharide synthesis family protein